MGGGGCPATLEMFASSNGLERPSGREWSDPISRMIGPRLDQRLWTTVRPAGPQGQHNPRIHADREGVVVSISHFPRNSGSNVSTDQPRNFDKERRKDGHERNDHITNVLLSHGKENDRGKESQ